MRLKGRFLRVGLAFVLAIVTIQARGVNITFAATTYTCQYTGINPTSRFSGQLLTVPVSSFLSQVQGTLANYPVPPLCNGPSFPLSLSMSSYWVMIAPRSGVNDYVQYGFINCAVTSQPGGVCPDDGYLHEFVEYNSGGLPNRFDLGRTGAGTYTMNITRTCSGVNCYFYFYRSGTLRGILDDDGWRTWSLYGANFEYFSETWNAGDQNGGTSAAKLYLQYGRYATNNSSTLTVANFTHPCRFLNSDYGCFSAQHGGIWDEMLTWTNDRPPP